MFWEQPFRVIMELKMSEVSNTAKQVFCYKYANVQLLAGVQIFSWDTESMWYSYSIVSFSFGHTCFGFAMIWRPLYFSLLHSGTLFGFELFIGGHGSEAWVFMKSKWRVRGQPPVGSANCLCVSGLCNIWMFCWPHSAKLENLMEFAFYP